MEPEATVPTMVNTHTRNPEAIIEFDVHRSSDGQLIVMHDATVDRNGEVWSGGEYNDRILRLDPKTGRFIEYLLPGHTNVRRVFVDNSTTPVTFWVGSNHAASIVKLEALDARPAPSTGR